jgi:vesicle transport protein SEC22
MKPTLRPYAFVQFDTFISATKRVYQDSRAQSNLDRLNVELQDVTRVMTKNIEDLIYRGDSLDRKFPSFSIDADDRNVVVVEFIAR